MTEREKFEAWAKGQQPGTLDLTPFEDTYDSDFTSRAWDAWQARALLAAGASEGPAEPIYQVKRVHGWVDVPESRYTEIKEDPNDCGELRILYLHPSAELAALRERIAGMEKDAQRYRYLRNCGVIVDFTHAGPWKFTDDVDAAVDKWLERKAAIAKEPK